MSKKIGLIATGGTIAGVQAPDMQSYTAGIMPIGALLSGLRFEGAEIYPTQLANIDNGIWLPYSRTVYAY